MVHVFHSFPIIPWSKWWRTTRVPNSSKVSALPVAPPISGPWLTAAAKLPHVRMEASRSAYSLIVALWAWHSHGNASLHASNNSYSSIYAIQELAFLSVLQLVREMKRWDCLQWQKTREGREEWEDREGREDWEGSPRVHSFFMLSRDCFVVLFFYCLVRLDAFIEHFIHVVQT